MDVIVCTAANSFETNFAFFQNIGGKAVFIYTNCSKLATSRTIYLKFDYYPGNSQNNHYSAIIEDTSVKPSGNERDINPDETGYEHINPSPTTSTSSLEDYINITQASTILEHDVNVTGDVLEECIQEKNQRTKSINKQKKEDGIKWICHY